MNPYGLNQSPTIKVQINGYMQDFDMTGIPDHTLQFIKEEIKNKNFESEKELTDYFGILGFLEGITEANANEANSQENEKKETQQETKAAFPLATKINIDEGFRQLDIEHCSEGLRKYIEKLKKLTALEEEALKKHLALIEAYYDKDGSDYLKNPLTTERDTLCTSLKLPLNTDRIPNVQTLPLCEEPAPVPDENESAGTPSEVSIAAPPPPEMPKAAPTENIQGDAIPQAPDQASKPRSKKPLILLAVLAVVAVAVFFGSGKMIDSYYASKAEECAAILTESKSLLDNLAEIPGDAASDDVKNVAEGLAKNADKLNSIRSGIIGKLPRNPQQEKTWNAIENNAEMLSKAAAMVRSQERAFAPMSIKRFATLCDECMAKWDEANTASTYATVKNQPLSDLIPYADIKKDLQTYRRNKQAFDAKHAQEKYNEELKKHQERNNELKKKSEVVFLADNAYKNGSDLILSGRFYNGTGDLVTSVMDMQIDLKVSLFGTEVQSLKDEPFSLQLSGLQLMPQQTTNVVQLRLPGKAPEEDFNEFEEHVHKIRWSRMKAR